MNESDSVSLDELARRGAAAAPPIEIAHILREGTRRKRRRRAGRRSSTVVLMAGMAAAAFLVPLAGGRSNSRPGPDQQALGNWLLVAPSNEGHQSDTPATFDVLSPTTGRLSGVVVERARGLGTYPWIPRGSFLVGVTELRTVHTPGGRDVEQGEAYAADFRTGGSAVDLGPAAFALPALRPDAIWLETLLRAPDGPTRSDPCTVREVTVLGHPLTPTYTFPCTRWIIGAVPGGFLSIPGVGNQNQAPLSSSGPTSTPNQSDRLQIWDPATGRVVRTIAPYAADIDGVSNDFVLWRAADGVANAQVGFVTKLSTGETRRFRLPVPDGLVLWPGDYLSQSGSLLAFAAITPATDKRWVAPLAEAEKCCVAPAVPGTGILRVFDAWTDRLVLTRDIAMSSYGRLVWTPDGKFVIATLNTSEVTIVPTWSPTAGIRDIEWPGVHITADAQQFVVVGR